MAATEVEIRAAIKALVEGVPDIGEVYDYERWAPRWPEYLELFKTSVGGVDQIRGWTIACERMMSVWEAYQFHRKTYYYVIRGYLGLDDSEATEKTAFALALAVVGELEQYPRLNGTLTNGVFADDEWPRIEVFEARMFGDVLCHYAEIRLAAYEKGAVTYQE